MAKRNPLIRSYPRRANKPLPNKSAGILDDYAVRKVIATKEGSITRTPVDDIDIANKKYVDDNAGGGLDNITKHLTIENPTSSEDFTMFHFPAAVTITEVVAVVVGSSTPSVTINPKHHTDRSNAGNALLSSATAITNTTTGQTISSFGDATLPADSYLWLETTAQSGTVLELHITITYTED